MHHVIVELERYFHDLGGDEQARFVIEDMLFLFVAIQKDKLGVVADRIKHAKGFCEILAALDCVDYDQDLDRFPAFAGFLP